MCVAKTPEPFFSGYGQEPFREALGKPTNRFDRDRGPYRREPNTRVANGFLCVDLAQKFKKSGNVPQGERGPVGERD